MHIRCNGGNECTNGVTCKDCNANEDDGEEGSIAEGGIKPVFKTVETKPSTDEVRQHEKTHIPFRAWCEHCVIRKAKATFHQRVEKKRRKSKIRPRYQWIICGWDQKKRRI